MKARGSKSEIISRLIEASVEELLRMDLEELLLFHRGDVPGLDRLLKKTEPDHPHSAMIALCTSLRRQILAGEIDSALLEHLAEGDIPSQWKGEAYILVAAAWEGLMPVEFGDLECAYLASTGFSDGIAECNSKYVADDGYIVAIRKDDGDYCADIVKVSKAGRKAIAKLACEHDKIAN